MNLSPHFTLEEALSSSTATRLGIDNTQTPDDVLAHMCVAAAGMEKVRSILNDHAIHVDSWLRCEALERVLTAKDFAGWCGRRSYPVNETSWQKYFAHKGHPKGYAVDFVCPDFGTPAEIVEAIKKSGLKVDEVVMEGSWVHCSFDPMMRMRFLVATFIDGTPSYTFS